MNEIQKTFEHDTFKTLSNEEKNIFINKRFLRKESIDDMTEKHLLLYPFVQDTPFKYMESKTYIEVSEFIEKNKSLFTESLIENRTGLSKAFLSFIHISENLKEEMLISTLEPKDIYLLDTTYHPEYIKNIEHVYVHLLNIIITTLNKINPNKNYSINDDLYLKLKIIKSNRLGLITKFCNTNIRNAIAHGKVFYEVNDIIYIDNKKTKKLSPIEFMKLLDGILNTCSSIFLAIIELIINDESDLILKSKEIPIGLIYFYLSSILDDKKLKFKYALENKIQDNKNQVIFHIQSTSNSKVLHVMEAFKIAYHLNSRFNHKYNRLGINIDTGKSIKPSLFINLDTLDEDINSNDFKLLENSLETSLLWHDENTLVRKIWTWKNLLHYSSKTFIKTFWEDYYSKLKEINFREYFQLKKIEDRSANSIGRIYIHVILIKEIDDSNIFYDLLLFIIKKNNKKHLLKVKDFKDVYKKIKPTYIWGSIYRQDVRLRNLNRKGNEICTFEWLKNNSKNNPILLKNEKENMGIRVKFF